MWVYLLSLASAVVLVCGAVEKIASTVKAARSPHDKQNERIEVLERWRADVDRKLSSDNDRLISIDTSSRVTQRAILALLDHGIDGNNTAQLERAREELQDHLINR